MKARFGDLPVITGAASPKYQKTGTMGYNVKSIRKEFKAKGVFYSDIGMAELLKSFMPVDITEVYDPTCGDGALLSVFPDNVRKFGQELNPEQAKVAAERLVNSEIAVGNTLTEPKFIDRRFKGIVANPPFSIKWTPPENPAVNPVFAEVPVLPPPGKADYAFLLHILHCLADDGIAAVLNFPGICYRGQREGKLRKWMIEHNLIDRVIWMEGGHFVDTKIATVILVLRKNRSEDYIFMRDNEFNLERKVSINEIAENDFSLNVGNYVVRPEPEKPKASPIELEKDARQSALKRIRSEIQFSLLVAQMEGWSIEPFLDSIQEIINEFRI